MTISTDGQLIEHIKELDTRCHIINRDICAIGEKWQVGKVEVSVKLKIFQACLMPAFLYGKKAWKKLSKAEIQHLEKIQGKAFTLTSVGFLGVRFEVGG